MYISSRADKTNRGYGHHSSCAVGLRSVTNIQDNLCKRAIVYRKAIASKDSLSSEPLLPKRGGGICPDGQRDNGDGTRKEKRNEKELLTFEITQMKMQSHIESERLQR